MSIHLSFLSERPPRICWTTKTLDPLNKHVWQENLPLSEGRTRLVGEHDQLEVNGIVFL